MSIKHESREEWLTQAVEKLGMDVFRRNMPKKLRVSCGFPIGGAIAKKNRKVGQCWDPATSLDKTCEIFISPVIADGVKALDVLTHELCHAIVGTDKGHRGPFKKLATKVGLVGKMTATSAGPELLERLNVISEELGDYPHAALDPSEKPKTQSTRMIKLECGNCGYVVRTTQKWIDVGLPICHCGQNFEIAPNKT